MRKKYLVSMTIGMGMAGSFVNTNVELVIPARTLREAHDRAYSLFNRDATVEVNAIREDND